MVQEIGRETRAEKGGKEGGRGGERSYVVGNSKLQDGSKSVGKDESIQCKAGNSRGRRQKRRGKFVRGGGGGKKRRGGYQGESGGETPESIYYARRG